MIRETWLRFKRFVLPYPLAYITKWLLRLLLWTCRFDFTGIDAFVAFAKQNRCILALWHNRLVIVPEVLNRFTQDLSFTAVISKSRDGEPLALVVKSYNRGGIIRVAHDDRHGALRTMIQHLKESNHVLVITPDGPRGPKYELKPGVVLASRAADAPIISLTWTANRVWTLKTWDGFMIPKPFSTIKVVFGSPISLSAKGSLKEDITSLQTQLVS